MEIYLVRHTAPAIPPGICYGQTDIDLADDFTSARLVLQNKLKAIATAHIYSSPLKRCLQLAEYTAAALNHGPVKQDARLKELNFGAWEMLAWRHIPETELNEWTGNMIAYAPPHGESIQDLSVRAQQFLNEIISTCANQPRIIVFTHAGIIRSLLAEILYGELRQAFNLHIDYGSVSKLTVTEQKVQADYVNQ
ncbi:MAG: alpha-ribazole phosphatase [Methylomonas sp.]